ncbi:MAG TPA: phosphoribosyltransferase family protein [Kofleriaceae bacterium]|nr:phosphoribosyltransferase family protein [Kofleriaceae bacterium]
MQPRAHTATDDEIRSVVVVQPRRGLPQLVHDALARSGALLRGHFGLRGGRHTEFFIRFRALSRDPALLSPIVDHLLAAVDLPPSPTVLVPESGGFFLGDAMRRRIGAPLAVARTDLQRRPARALLHGALPAGGQVVVVNDVVTTGASIEPLLDLVGDHGASVAAALVFGALDGTGFRSTLNRRRVPGDHLLEASERWSMFPAEACELCRRGGPPLVPAAELN